MKISVQTSRDTAEEQRTKILHQLQTLASMMCEYARFTYGGSDWLLIHIDRRLPNFEGNEDESYRGGYDMIDQWRDN